MRSKLILTSLFVCALFVAANFQEKTTVYMIGDSTMANKRPEKFPETGWGQALVAFFDLNKVTIDNRAADGRSTKSFIAENRWEPVRVALKKGDYVFIEFGHNDEKIEDPKRGTTPEEFKTNLLRFINETKEKGAIPVLMTPVSRRSFYNKGEFIDSHGAYGQAVRSLSAQGQVAFVDMQQKSEALIKQLGNGPSKKLFNWADSAVRKNYPNGVKDNTHFSPEGATVIAQMAVDGIRELKLPLEKLLVKEK